MIKKTLLLITLCALSQAEGAPRPREATFKKKLETLHHDSICAFTAQERRKAEAALRFLKQTPNKKPKGDILETLQKYKLASKKGTIYKVGKNTSEKVHAGKAAPTGMTTRSITRAKRKKKAS